MKKVDSTVKKETKYIAVFVILLSMLMEAVFLILRRWSLPVLWGNLLGGATAVLNFFLMGITVQKAVTKEKKEAGDLMKLSMTLRNFMLIGVGVLGAVLKCFNLITVLVPFFFPRIAVALRPAVDKRRQGGE